MTVTRLNDIVDGNGCGNGSFRDNANDIDIANGNGCGSDNVNDIGNDSGSGSEIT